MMSGLLWKSERKIKKTVSWRDRHTKLHKAALYFENKSALLLYFVRPMSLFLQTYFWISIWELIILFIVVFNTWAQFLFPLDPFSSFNYTLLAISGCLPFLRVDNVFTFFDTWRMSEKIPSCPTCHSYGETFPPSRHD